MAHINDAQLNFQGGIGPQHILFLQHMDTVGDGSGTSAMNIDGSLVSVPFYIKPAAGDVVRLAKAVLYVQDTGSFDATLWASGLVLTNGLLVEMQIDGVLYSMVNGAGPLKTTGDVASVAYDISIITAGVGDEFLVAMWSFAEMGQYLRLDGDKGDFFRVTIQDDLTGVNKQHIQGQGYYE